MDITFISEDNHDVNDPANNLTRPEVSEGGPAITSLIQGVAREEADRHRQIEVSIDLPF